MILFFGTKPGKRVERTLTYIPCPHCEQTGTLTAVVQPNYFHLFWLPLFNRYAECTHCKRVYYENEFTAAMKSALPS